MVNNFIMHQQSTAVQSVVLMLMFHLSVCLFITHCYCVKAIDQTMSAKWWLRDTVFSCCKIFYIFFVQ